MIRRPPKSICTDTLFPSTPPFRSRSRIRDRDRGTARFVGSCHPCSGRRRARPAPPRADDRRAGRHGFDIREASAFEMAFLTEMAGQNGHEVGRSEEHTSELQSLMRISYAVFCLKKKIKIQHSLVTHGSPNRNKDSNKQDTKE